MAAKPKGTSRIAGTLIDRLLQSLEQAGRHQPGEVAIPAAILWTDSEAQWKPLIELLQVRMPHLVVFGPYDPAKRIGPAIWLKCVVARKLDAPRIADDVVPVIYLPEVSRQALRAGEECPEELQPVVELQYRGTIWTQRNGKDWTVEAFLTSEDGLGLDISKDVETREAMRRSLAVLAGVPLTQLSGRLEAKEFDRLLVDDHTRDVLVWMSDSIGTRSKWKGDRWNAFRSRSKDTYKFDPEKDGETVAGEKLGLREGAAWQALWGRYVEAPDWYPGIPSLLDRSKPSGRILFDKSTWPDENQKAEDALRASLLDLANADPAEARRIVATLEREHGVRRQWVWARLGRSPLAGALEQVAVLAERSATSLGGETPEEMARLYAEAPFRVDDAAVRALAAIKTASDQKAIGTAVRAVYMPWLEATATHFQKLLFKHPLPTKAACPTVEASTGECLLFADGLRYDLAQRLYERLAERGLKTTAQRRWAGLPSVTATAKPAVSPISDCLYGKVIPDSFAPMLAPAGPELNTDRFRKLLADRGYQFIPATETGRPGEVNARGWTEFGEIDEAGHKMQSRVVEKLDGELDTLLERVAQLLDAGWRAVRVVTDHGWLLMPGGLPKQELPAYLVGKRWGRCATIKGNSKVSVPKANWHWNPNTEFATAPGISCFYAGYEYDHGGLSLQECLVLDLRVEPREAEVSARIAEIRWMGMRCRIRAEAAPGRIQVDIRSKANDPASSLASSPKPVGEDGQCSMVVENEDLAGTAALVVLLDQSGRVLAKESTVVAGSE